MILKYIYGLNDIDNQSFLNFMVDTTKNAIYSELDGVNAAADSISINDFDAEELETRFRKVVIDKVKKARVIVS